VQRPGGTGVIVAEEIGADRLRQSGIVEQDREVFPGLLAAALPGGPDLRALRITDNPTVVTEPMAEGALD